MYFVSLSEGWNILSSTVSRAVLLWLEEQASKVPMRYIMKLLRQQGGSLSGMGQLCRHWLAWHRSSLVICMTSIQMMITRNFTTSQVVPVYISSRIGMLSEEIIGFSLSRVTKRISIRNRSCQRSQSLRYILCSQLQAMGKRCLATSTCILWSLAYQRRQRLQCIPGTAIVLENSQRHLFSTKPLCQTTLTPIPTNFCSRSPYTLTPRHYRCCTAISTKHSQELYCSSCRYNSRQIGIRQAFNAQRSSEKSSVSIMNLGYCSMTLQSRFDILLLPNVFPFSQQFNSQLTNFYTNFSLMQSISSGLEMIVCSKSGVNFSLSNSILVESRETQLRMSGLFLSWKCISVSRLLRMVYAKSGLRGQRGRKGSMQ